MNLPRRFGLPVALAAFAVLLMVPAPTGLTPAGWRTAAVALLMAILWISEAIPIPATALLPLVMLPLLGVLDMRAAAQPYSNDLIFLQMGGFLLAVTMERWGLHRRIALGVVAAVGTAPERLVLGFMLASAFLSMWISNTATTAMMLPIAIAAAQLFRDQERKGPYALGICLMLGIAYAATIGGVSTLIGTPPNAVLAAAASEMLGVQVGFLQWMMVGLPVSAVLLPLGWFLLTRWLHPPGKLTGDAKEVLKREQNRLGRMSRGEKSVAVVFVLTALAWVLRAPKTFGAWHLPGIQTWAPEIRDSTIAVAAAVVLFMLPVNWKARRFTLEWSTAVKIPWGVLVLFGGGLSLARAMDESGLAAWIGSGVAGLGFLPPWMLIAAVGALFVFLTEITSNVATATMAMPVMLGAAQALGMEPLVLMAIAALASSMAFMLPVATPPNAIVFASGYLTIPQMARVGVYFNLLAIVLLTLAGIFLVPMLVR